jgi:membrane protein YqaA with SNARE-associated domain
MIKTMLVAAGVGGVSALLPVVNAEAFQAGASLLQPRSVVVACVVALAFGQTGGKLVIFTASRRGATRWRSTHTGRPSRAPTWVRRTNAQLLRWLSHPTAGPAAVTVSATVGLPPLALVSATAGASTIRCATFALACFAGRLVRFAALAGGVVALGL